MSLVEGRGGHPHIFSATVDNSDGRHHRFGFTSKYLIIRASTNPCKVYFSEADFTADENFITVPIAAAATPNGEWRGPFEANQIWMKGSGGNSGVQLVAFQRRG